MGNYRADFNGHKMSNDHSIMKKINDFHESFVEHEELKLNILAKSPVISINSREVEVLERHTNNKIKALMFGSNNYLGAISQPEIIEKTVNVVREYGIGSGGVPVLSGTSAYHTELEAKLSELTGFEDTMLFSSGFTANLGAILGLLRPKNLILQDKLNHASLIDGGLMSGAKMIRYKHNDPASLDKILKDYHDDYVDGIIVVTDGVFSMDGDVANLPELLKVVKKYNAILMIDEAHSTGVIGKDGAGTLSYHNITERENIILTGTLSKAIGVVGGYVSASKKVIDYLRIYARSNLYSTSLPPSVCASAIEVLKYMKESDVIDRLHDNSEYLTKKLKANGYNTLDTVTAVIPIIVGDDHKLTMMSKDLLERGIFVSSIFAPAVPPKLSRIRVNMSSVLTKEDIDYFVSVLNELFDKYNIVKNI